MRSTFMGLETAKRGMYSQQSAIYVTGHNIANKNTPGYTRQRVNFVQETPYPAASMNRPQIPGQLGTGVKDGTIQRIRDSLVDGQYRTESNKLGYYESYANSVKRMEEIMNEPSDYGLAKAMNQFWQSLEDLSTNPENEGARRVVLQRGKSVAETFQYLHKSLTTVKAQLGQEIDVTVKEINSIAVQIAAVNQKISDVEPHGYLPNDLYDERDRLLDKLAQIVPVETKYNSSGGNALEIADGVADVTITLGGQAFTLVKGNAASEIKAEKPAPNQAGDLISLTFVDRTNGNAETAIAINPVESGKLNALFQAYGYEDANGNTAGLYPNMIDELDRYAFSFAKIFNTIHQEGFDKEGKPGQKFFTLDDTAGYKGFAGKIKVEDLKPNQIAASDAGDPANPDAIEEGNGKNALALANMKDLPIKNSQITLPSGTIVGGLEIESGTIQSYYEGLIGDMAVKGQQANRQNHNSEVLLTSIDKTRKSISEVSLDEEFSNLVQFQHAYSASARMITTIDEMLEKIINGMGHVGR